MGHELAHTDGQIRTTPIWEVRKPFPTLRDVVNNNNRVVALGSIASVRLIDTEYADRDPLPKRERSAFKDVIDNGAAISMEIEYERGIAPGYGVFVVDCEGKKEYRKEKRILYIPSGYFGPKDGKIRSFNALDPLEGTTPASSNQEGSICIAAGAISLPGEISRLPFIPPEESDAVYMRRLIASKQLRGITAQMSVKEIVDFVMDRLRLVDRRQVEFVVLERPRNKALIEAIQNAGATFTPIDGGDLVPGLAALKPINMMATKSSERKAIISAGSGGKTEALIAAIAAKATGGVFFGNFEDGEGNQSLEYPGLKGENWVPYRAEECFVSFAPVTGINPKWGFDMQRVNPHVNGILEYRVPVIDITSVGDNFFKTVHTFPA